MKKTQNQNLKLALQKNGRLTAEAIKFLQAAGLDFEGSGNTLFTTCRNFPLEIVFVRDEDIPDYVESGVVDMGIVGQNLVNEFKSKVTNLLNLDYAFCSLSIAVPKE